MADTPITVSGLTVTAGLGTLTAQWIYDAAPAGPLPYLQLDHFEVWVATTNDRAGASKAADSIDLAYALSGLATADTRYFWVRAVDKSANVGDWYPASSTGGVSQVAAFPVADTAAMIADFGTMIRSLIADAQALAAIASGGSLADYSDRQAIRTELSIAKGDVTARYLEAIDVATGPSSALVSRVTILEASVNDPSTGVAVTASALIAATTRITTVEGQVSTQSSYIAALQAQMGNTGSSAVFAMQTGFTPASGWTSRGGWVMAVTAGGTTYAAGIYLEAKVGSSRTVIDTGQLVVTDGTNVAALFDTGTVYIATARIRNLDATNITASKIDAGLILQNGTTITALIAAGAVSVISAVTNASQTNITSTSPSLPSAYVDICSLTFTPNGGGTVVMCYGYGYARVAGISSAGRPRWRLTKNGTEVAAVLTDYDDGTFENSFATFLFTDTSPGTSSTTWKFQCRVDSGSSGEYFTVGPNAAMSCQNLKK